VCSSGGVDHAGRMAVSTLRRRLAAISEVHQAARFANPTIGPGRAAWRWTASALECGLPAGG